MIFAWPFSAASIIAVYPLRAVRLKSALASAGNARLRCGLPCKLRAAGSGCRSCQGSPGPLANKYADNFHVVLLRSKEEWCCPVRRPANREKLFGEVRELIMLLTCWGSRGGHSRAAALLVCIGDIFALWTMRNNTCGPCVLGGGCQSARRLGQQFHRTLYKSHGIRTTRRLALHPTGSAICCRERRLAATQRTSLARVFLSSSCARGRPSIGSYIVLVSGVRGSIVVVAACGFFASQPGVACFCSAPARAALRTWPWSSARPFASGGTARIPPRNLPTRFTLALTNGRVCCWWLWNLVASVLAWTTYLPLLNKNIKKIITKYTIILYYYNKINTIKMESVII